MITPEKIQGEVTDKAREIWLAGLGIFSTVEEEGAKLFNKFLEKGKELEAKGEALEKKAKDKVSSISTLDDVSKFVEEKVNLALETMGISSHAEVRQLSEKVDKLAANVEILAKKLDTTGKTTVKTTRPKA